MTTRTPARGWRALLWMVGTFALVQFAAGLILDYGVPGIRNPLPRMHLRSIASRYTTPEIICLGTSRTGCCIDDRLTTRWLRDFTRDPDVQVFNAGVPAADPETWEPLLERLLARAVPPRLLVLELLPESVTDRSYCVRYHIVRQLTWTTCLDHLHAILATNSLSGLVTSRLLPLFAFRERIREGIGASIAPPVRPTGHATEAFSMLHWEQIVVPRTTARETESRLRKGIDQVIRELVDYAPRGPSRTALERALGRCRAAGVPVVLLGVPVAGSHRACYTPTVEARFRAYVEELTTEFGATYIDCRDALPDEVFVDQNHAGPEGRERFSQHLAGAILAPLWEAPTRR